MRRDDFERVIREAKATGESVVEVVLRLGLGDEKAAYTAQARSMGYGFVDLPKVKMDPAEQALISADLAWIFRALPLRSSRGTVWVGMDDPLQVSIEAIQLATTMQVVPVLVISEPLTEALEAAYGSHRDDEAKG